MRLPDQPKALTFVEEALSRTASWYSLRNFRSSAFQFKGKNEDLRSVGQKLGVANMLEGSIRKEGNHVRITADLIKADDGFQLWSETYDREVSHIFAAQDEIARAVTGALQMKLLSANDVIRAGSRITNPEAYQAYLQGQYFIARGQDKEDLDKVLSYADQAIKSDATYAPAWAQRAQVLETLARVALIENNNGFRLARESAEKTIALDPNLATGYLAMGLIQINHAWDWDGADVSLKKLGCWSRVALRSWVIGRISPEPWAGWTSPSHSTSRRSHSTRCEQTTIWRWVTNFTSWADMKRPRPPYKGLKS